MPHLTYDNTGRSITSYTDLLEEQQDKLKEAIDKVNNRLDTGELDNLRLLAYLTYNEKVDALFKESYNQHLINTDISRKLIIERLYEMDQRQDKLAKSINYLGVVIILLCIIIMIFFFKLEGI